MSKKLIHFFLLLTVGSFFYMTSCSKNEIGNDQLNTEETRINAVLEHTEDNNLPPGATLETRDGHVINPDSLPGSIIDYVHLNYGDTILIRKAIRFDNGNYVIRISNGKILLFDQQGVFIREIKSRRHCDGKRHDDSTNNDGHHHDRDSMDNHHDRDSSDHDGDHHGDHHHDRDSLDQDGHHHDRDSSDHDGNHHKGNLTPVSVDALPSAILQYFSANYPAAVLKKAVKNNDTHEYIVRVIIDDKRYEFFFDENGLFLRKRP